ncbi:unnamed protein product [Closterium sp. NIES-54]
MLVLNSSLPFVSLFVLSLALWYLVSFANLVSRSSLSCFIFSSFSCPPHSLFGLFSSSSPYACTMAGGTCLAVSFTAGAGAPWPSVLPYACSPSRLFGTCFSSLPPLPMHAPWQEEHVWLSASRLVLSYSAPAPQRVAATAPPEAAQSAVQVVVTTAQPEDLSSSAAAAPAAAPPAEAKAATAPPPPPTTAKTAAPLAPSPSAETTTATAAAALATPATPATASHVPTWLPLTALFARHSEQLREVFGVLIPATVASGMLQIATFTDLYFASFLPGTAAALGYANLLCMAPLGILSTALLVPLLPLFARLAHAVTLPMTAVMLPLARPIVRTVFQRRSFDASATSLVSSLLSCYLLGSPCYLARDVLVRLFYSLADGTTPFLISTFAIAANAVLDFLFVSRWEFGPQGLVLATAAVNSASAVALLWLAHRRMGAAATAATAANGTASAATAANGTVTASTNNTASLSPASIPLYPSPSTPLHLHASLYPSGGPPSPSSPSSFSILHSYHNHSRSQTPLGRTYSRLTVTLLATHMGVVARRGSTGTTAAAGLPFSLWWPSFSILFQSAAATAITVTTTHKLLSAALTATSHSLSLQSTWVWLLDAAALGTAAAAGFLVFCTLVVTMRLPEAMPLWARLKSLLQKYGLLKLRTSAQS